MNTQPARLYYLGRAKRTTNLASINSSDVKEMPIPVPPKPKQVEIVKAVGQLRQKVLASLQRASLLESKANDEIEELLVVSAVAA
jgi:type I restriction enzyme S subunit